LVTARIPSLSTTVKRLLVILNGVHALNCIMGVLTLAALMVLLIEVLDLILLIAFGRILLLVVN
jgi:hypothetical protein